jgi:hypothetical protein
VRFLQKFTFAQCFHFNFRQFLLILLRLVSGLKQNLRPVSPCTIYHVSAVPDTLDATFRKLTHTRMHQEQHSEFGPFSEVVCSSLTSARTLKVCGSGT